MSVARRLAVASAVVGLGVLAYAVPASATESRSSEGCITNPTSDQLVASLEPRHGIAHVRAADGVDLCADVLLSVYRVPDTWVGPDFDETAVPQQVISTAVGHVEGTKKIELSVPIPHCGALQVDLYFPPEITTVGPEGHQGQLIQNLGYIWRWWANGKPLNCDESTPTPTPSSTPTTSAAPAPSGSTTSATPTPTETGSTAPAPETTTPIAAVIPPPGATAGPIVQVPAAPAPAAPPVLASTGSNATIPLLGIGVALLGAGIGLSLLGRRRRTTA